MNKSPSFNLVHEPWIPVINDEGKLEDVSLVDLFGNAQRIRMISAELPQMTFVLVRLMLALMYRAYYQEGRRLTAKQLKSLWAAIWTQGSFADGRVAEYLSKWENRFDLFDQEHPFYQVSGLEYQNKPASKPSVIMLDVPSKAEKYLFAMKSQNSIGSLTYSEAARYLLLSQSFDVSGIKTAVVGNTHERGGKVYPAGQAWCGYLNGVMLEGNSLFETLMLNWVLFGSGSSEEGLYGVPGDLPPWELPSPGPDQREREPKGPVQLLTWQSRRLRLITDSEKGCVTGVYLCYGDITKPNDKQSLEMMCSWRESKAQQKQLGTPYIPLMPALKLPGHALWRGLRSLLALSDAPGEQMRDLRPGVVRWMREVVGPSGPVKEDKSLTVHALGFIYGTQNSVIDDSVDDSFNFESAMVRDDSEAKHVAIEVVEKAELAVGAVKRFVQNVEQATGDHRNYESFSDSVAAAVKADIEAVAFSRLDALFRVRLAGFSASEDVLAYRKLWLTEMFGELEALADEYLARCQTNSFMGNENMTVGRARVILGAKLVKICELEGNDAPRRMQEQETESTAV